MKHNFSLAKRFAFEQQARNAKSYKRSWIREKQKVCFCHNKQPKRYSSATDAH